MSIDMEMIRFRILNEFNAALATVSSPEGLRQTLIAAKEAMGFDYVAMTHHVDIREGSRKLIRIHDYPEAWVERFDQLRLGRVDPVHRASQTRKAGFLWNDIGQMIYMSHADRAIMDTAREYGIGDGFTVPAHVPGESNGSVSFAMGVGRPIPHDMLTIAPQIADRAFDTARLLWGVRPPFIRRPILTAAQSRCLKWIFRGKSDSETGQIEKIQTCTVARHVRHARERYGVEKRTSLLSRTLLDGTLSLADFYDY